MFFYRNWSEYPLLNNSQNDITNKLWWWKASLVQGTPQDSQPASRRTTYLPQLTSLTKESSMNWNSTQDPKQKRYSTFTTAMRGSSSQRASSTVKPMTTWLCFWKGRVTGSQEIPAEDWTRSFVSTYQAPWHVDWVPRTQSTVADLVFALRPSRCSFPNSTLVTRLGWQLSIARLTSSSNPSSRKTSTKVSTRCWTPSRPMEATLSLMASISPRNYYSNKYPSRRERTSRTEWSSYLMSAMTALLKEYGLSKWQLHRRMFICRSSAFRLSSTRLPVRCWRIPKGSITSVPLVRKTFSNICLRPLTMRSSHRPVTWLSLSNQTMFTHLRSSEPLTRSNLCLLSR